MKIEQLRQMVELSKTGSMHQAAANLYMSQPNLSVSIRKLEEELGTALIVRGSRGVTMTSRGEAFVEYASSVLAQFDRLGDLCRSFDRGPAPVFSLATCRYRFISDAAARLSRESRFAPISLQITESTHAAVVERVQKGDSEIGFIGFMSIYRKDILHQFKAKELQYHRLSTQPLSVVVGPASSLYTLPPDTELTAAMLEGIPQITYDQMDYSHFADRHQKMKLPVPPCEFQVDSRSIAHELLENTNAYMITHTDTSAYRHTSYYPNLRRFRLPDTSVLSELGWICREKSVLSPLAAEFIQILDSYFA